MQLTDRNSQLLARSLQGLSKISTMISSSILYLLIVAFFAVAYILAWTSPGSNSIGYACAIGTLLFIWRIVRGDD